MEPVTNEVETYLVSLCSAMGGFELVNESTEKYILGDECIDCLKDLKRLLRQDDKTEDKYIFRLLGKWNFVATDLVPILCNYAHDTRLVQSVVEVLVPLTWPLEKSAGSAAHLDQSRYMNQYLDTLSTAQCLDVLFNLMLEPLSVNHRERTQRQQDMIRLILLLIRNLARIDVSLPDDRPSGLIGRLEQANFLELLITLASVVDEANHDDYNTILLDIVYTIFSPYDPADLFQEMAATKEVVPISIPNVKKSTPIHMTRHPRFRTALTIQMGDKRTVLNTVVAKKQETWAAPKQPVHAIALRRIKNIETPTEKKVRSAEHQKVLRQFALGFVESAYNVLMDSVRNDIRRERVKIQADDQYRFMMIVAFFMKMARVIPKPQEFEISWIAITFDVPSSISIIRKIEEFHLEKDAKLCHASLKALNEILALLDFLMASPNSTGHDAALHIIKNLFYEKACLDIINKMVKYPLITQRWFLETTISMNFYTIRLLEKQLQSQSSILIRKKKKVKASNEDEYETDEEESRKARFEYKEVQMEFSSVVMSYANEATVNTYMSLLRDYEKLDSQYIRQLTKLMHRLFVSHKVEAVFYKLDNFILFDAILTHSAALICKNSSFKDLIQFLRYVVHRFFDNLKKYPLLYVEILYPKGTKADWRHIQDSDTEKPQPKVKITVSNEVEVKKSLPWSEKVGVVVGALSDQFGSYFVRNLTKVIQVVAQNRDSSEEIDLPFEDDGIRKSVISEPLVKALFELFDFKLVANDEAMNWRVPKTVDESRLNAIIKIVEDYLAQPLITEEPRERLIRRKRAEKDTTSSSQRKSREQSEKSTSASLMTGENGLSKAYVETSDDEDDEEIYLYNQRMRLMQDATSDINLQHLSVKSDDESEASENMI